MKMEATVKRSLNVKNIGTCWCGRGIIDRRSGCTSRTSDTGGRICYGTLATMNVFRDLDCLFSWNDYGGRNSFISSR